MENGTPFREAHHIVGKLIGEAEKAGISFLDLPAAAWKSIPNAEKMKKQLTYAASAERRNIQGGTGSQSVAAQLKEAEKLLKWSE